MLGTTIYIKKYYIYLYGIYFTVKINSNTLVI